MKDVYIVMDYPRVDHFKKVGNELKNVYLNTQTGKLLKAVVSEYAKIGTDRFDIGYTYTNIPEPLQTKGNKVIKYKEPKIAECKEHFENLKNTIIANKPKMVMPLGKLGCKALINETGITSARGVPKKVTLENEIDSHTFWVLPTFSIEYVSIKPNLERHVATDFMTLRKFLENGDKVFESKEVRYELVTTIERVREIFNNEIHNANNDGYDIVAWDLETNSLRPEIKGSKALVLSMTWANGQGVTIPLHKSDFQWANGQQDIDEIMEHMKKWLANKDMQKVGHNIQYDIKFLMLAHDFKILESNQDTKVGWYLAVTQEKSESLRLSNLAYEATDMGGYDKPLEDFKVWYKTVLLKFLEKELGEIVKKNKDLAKKNHNVNKTDYNKWISEQIDPNKKVVLDEQEQRFGVTNIEKQYMDLGLIAERLNLNMLIDNEVFKSTVEQSPEYMALTEQAKSFVLNNALEQINEHKKATNVRNEIDGGDFSYDWFPLELMHPYASGDTDCCRRIYCDIRERLKDRPKAIKLLTHDYPRLTRTLAKIEYNGMYVNSEYANANNDNYKQKLKEIIEEINNHWSAQEVIDEKNKLYMLAVEDFNSNKPADRDKELMKIRNKYKDSVIDFNPKSGDDKGKLFFDVLGIELPYQKEFIKDKPFQDGKKEKDLIWSDYKTDKKVIEYIVDHYPEHKDIMKLFLDYSSISTRQSTFTSMLVENPVNGYVHPTYNSTGTECVSGDTLLITDKGIKEIQKLSENRKDKTFSDLDIKVPNHNGGVSKSSAFYYSGVGKSLKIRLENGMEIVTSYNHPLRKNMYYVNGKRAQNNNQKSKHFNTLEWVQASNINKGDYLQISLGTNLYGDIVDLDYGNEYVYKKVTNSKEYTLPKVLTPELAELIGIFMADGNIKCGNGTKTIVISNNDIEVLNRVEYIVNKEFNIQCTIEKDRTCYNVKFTSLKVVTWFGDIFGIRTGSLNKTVPDVILSSTKENQQNFIKGLSLDSSTKKKKYPSIYFSSVSKDLANKLRVMLMNMGIYTRMSVTEDDRKDTYNTLYTNQITYENVKKYMNEIGFIQDRKVKDIENKLQEFKGKTGKNKGMVSDGNIFLAKVEDIVYNGEIPLFDLHVPNEHSFVGNGIVNHNTSRLSSRNPNAQNLPSKTTKVNQFDYKNPIKRAFQTRFDNGGLIQLDYSSLEMRIIALYTQDKEMTKSFFDGDDIHKATASIMHNVPTDEVTAEQRQQAKSVNFGLAYGESPFSFAGKNDMTVEEAESIFDQYYSTKPKVKGSIDDVHDFVTKHGYVETMQGHRRNLKGAQTSDLKIKNEAFRQSFNTIIQGTGGYLTNMSLTYIDDYLTKYNMKSKIIATVHDSILIDSPKEEIDNIIKISKYIMENLPFDFLKIQWEGKEVPFPVKADAEVGLTYNDVVEYDSEEFKTFNSVKGYSDYHNALDKIQHTFETGLITEEQRDQIQEKVKSQKEIYQKL